MTKLFTGEKTERFLGYAQNLKNQGFRTGIIFPDIKTVDQETCVNKGTLVTKFI